MIKATQPFASPVKLPLDLDRIRDYWESLRRGDNEMPFWDDVNLSSLPDLSDRLMLIDTFENPQRFRFNSVGKNIRELYGTDLVGKFVDKIDAKRPFEFFTSQASATIESKVPTFFSSNTGASDRPYRHYARLLLPMWGNGRIEMMLCGLTEGKS